MLGTDRRTERSRQPMTAETLIRALQETPAGTLPEKKGCSAYAPMDEPAFQIFYRKTAPALFSYIRLAVKDPPLSEDILQEAFYRFLCANLSNLNEFQMKT